MSCERMRDLMLDSLAGELAPEQLEELRTHVAECAECAPELESWQELWRDLGAAAIPRQAADGLERLQARIREEPGRSGRPGGARRAGWRWAASILVTLALGALLGWVLGTRDSEAPEVAPGAGDRYVMILARTTEPPEETERLREEMGEWFTALSERGVVETFFGFAEEPAVGTPPDRSLLAGDIAGLIVFRAPSPEEARRIGLSSPSLRYGGEVEVRRLD